MPRKLFSELFVEELLVILQTDLQGTCRGCRLYRCFLPVVSYDYPVFNIADSGIFVGAITYLFGSYGGKKCSVEQ